MIQAKPAVPVFSHEQNCYSVVFGPGNERIVFDRVLHNGNRIEGEITVDKVDDEGVQIEHYLGPAWTLIDDLDRNNRVIDNLEKNDGLGRPWRQWFIYTVRKIIMEFNKGEPFTDLRAYTPEDPGAPFINGFMPRGNITLLSGDGGTLKSLLAAAVCLTVLTGKTIIPGWHLNVPPGPVMYLDWESSRDDILLRAYSIAKWAGIEWEEIPHEFIYYPMWDALARNAAKPAKEAIKKGVRLLVVDSVGYAAGAELNKPEAAKDMYNIMRGIMHDARSDMAALCIGHIAKSAIENPGRRRTFGSGFFEFGARCVWEVRRKSESDDELPEQELDQPVLIALQNTKANNDRLQQQVFLEVAFSGPGQPGSITRTGIPLGDTELTAGMGVYSLVEAILAQEGPSPIFRVAELLGKLPEEVERILKKMGDKVMNVNREWADAAGRTSVNIWALAARERVEHGV